MPRFKQEKEQYKTPLQRAEEMVASEMDWIDMEDEVWGSYDSDMSEDEDGYVSPETQADIEHAESSPEWQLEHKREREEYRQKRISELTAYFEAEDKKRLTKERLTLLKGKPKKGT